MYFAGWTVSCIFIPRLADIYGRKWPLLASASASFAFYLGLILSRNLNLSIGLLFFMGCCCTGKVGTSYVLLLELVPARSVTFIGTIVMFLDGSTMIWISLYFRYVSKEWLYF